MSKLTRFGNKLLFGVKKNKNTIELVVGIGAVIAGSTLLVKNASKIVDANDELHFYSENIKCMKEEGYSKQEISSEFKGAIKKCGPMYAVSIGIPAVLEAGGLSLILVSHANMAKQITTLSTSLATISMSFNEYRKRIRSEYGDQVDQEMLTGEKMKKMIIKNEDGTISEKYELGKENLNPHSFLFDEGSTNWQKNAGANYDFLYGAEILLQRKLAVKGYLTENDVRETLGCELSPTGMNSGFLYDESDGTINCISLGLNRQDPQAEAFRNGTERNFWVQLQYADGRPIVEDLAESISLGFH